MMYDNQRKRSPLKAVEFSEVAQGNFAFFYIDRPAQKDAVKTWITGNLKQEIIAETVVGGHPVLVTRGEKKQADVLKMLADHGDQLTPHKEVKGFDFWKWRSVASVAGQSLQMFSAFSQLDPIHKIAKHEKWASIQWKDKSGPEPSMFMFAALNMTANVFNYFFGSQKSQDTNQLKFLKDQSNRRLESHLVAGERLPGVNEDRAHTREGPIQEKTVLQRMKQYVSDHSVIIGEIGLRYIAAFGLVVPMSTKGHLFGGWQKFGKLVAKGEFAEAWEKSKNPKDLIRYAGLAYLVGKGMALFTKVKDPYEAKKHTWVDTLREDIIFKVGSLVETGAGLTIAYNGFERQAIKPSKVSSHLPDGPNGHIRDYAAAVGGSIFAGGYLIRLGAPFGEKQFNLKELESHVSDSLARVKKEDVPQLAADNVAAFTDHFNGKKVGGKSVTFGDMFSRTITDLYKHNKIALPNLEGSPEEQIAKMNTLTHTPPKVVETVVYDTRRDGAGAAQHQPLAKPSSEATEVNIGHSAAADEVASDEPSAKQERPATRTAMRASIPNPAHHRPADTHAEQMAREQKAEIGISA